MTLGVRAVVRSPKGEFLLVRHTYTPGWHFPSSGVEVGQATEEALFDELAQETGLAHLGRGSTSWHLFQQLRQCTRSYGG